MPSKKSRAGAGVPGTKSEQQPISLTPKKKRVAVDQYMARTLLQEIPTRMPRKGETVTRPATLPTMVQQKAQNNFYCEVCQVSCSSFPDLTQHRAGQSHRKNVLIRAINLNSDELKKDKLGIKIRVENATVAKSGDVEASVNIESSKTKYAMMFVLENYSEATVQLCHCDILKPYGFTRGQIDNRGKIEPGGSLQIELRAKSSNIGCLPTIIVFMLTPASTTTNLPTSGTGFPDTLSSGDTSSGSKSSRVTARLGGETGATGTGNVAYIIRRVKVYFEDPQMAALRPTAPFKRPPRVSGKHATVQIDGLPLERRPKDVDQLEVVEELEHYNVPVNVRRAVNHGLDAESASASSMAKDKARIRHLLTDTLTADTHRARFQLLLQLEEIQMEVDIRKYDLVGVQLGRYNADPRLLTLEVPGLMENRPSVLKGDHLFISHSSDSADADDTRRCEYKGYVHEVHSSQVCLGFSDKLMRTWVANMKFDCRFVFSRLPQRLQHRAVKLAYENSLGEFLFPTSATACNRSIPIIPLDRLSDIKLYDQKIGDNAEQLSAIKHILAGSSRPAPFLVFGPPGTGKTVTIVEAMKQVWKLIDDAHILACAPSNAAADLLAERLLQHLPSSSLLRMCAYSRDWNSVPSSIKGSCNYRDGRIVFPCRKELMKYKVVVSTLVTAGRLVTANFPSSHFSHIFMDESGQATEPETLIAIAGIFESEVDVKDGGQVVLAGDPEQLGPVLRSPLAIRDGLATSLLERYMRHTDVYNRKPVAAAGGPSSGVYDDRLVVKLLHNYRSHPDILHIPNQSFYEGELIPCADEGARTMLCSWPDLPKREFPMVFHGVIGRDEREERSPSFFNVDEISVVMRYVASLLDSRRPKIQQKQIGIISPYRKQVQKIRRALEKKRWTDVAVGSVEEFQGQERLVIIISTVRSSDAYVPRDCDYNLGFLRNPKRFNVAVTRSKALLIVVGNPFLLSKDQHWNRLLEFCVEHGAYTGCEFKRTDADTDDLLTRMSELKLDENLLPSGDVPVGEITEQLEPEWPVKE